MSLTALLEMQGAGLTPLDFAICLVRIDGHLDARRPFNYAYISTMRRAGSFQCVGGHDPGSAGFGGPYAALGNARRG